MDVVFQSNIYYKIEKLLQKIRDGSLTNPFVHLIGTYIRTNTNCDAAYIAMLHQISNLDHKIQIKFDCVDTIPFPNDKILIYGILEGGIVFVTDWKEMPGPGDSNLDLISIETIYEKVQASLDYEKPTTSTHKLQHVAGQIRLMKKS